MSLFLSWSLAPVVVRRLVVLMVAAGMGRQMTLLFGPD
jgi:hypothetical protein